jgi:hypothetical protein
LLTAAGDGYLTSEDLDALLSDKREVGRMLGSMIQNPASFLVVGD